MPKTNYFSFGKGPERSAYDSVYLPGNNSPRLKDAKKSPGPGEYTPSATLGSDSPKWGLRIKPNNQHGKSLAIF